jgi:DNA-binding MarR family transcriptional regulator
MADKSTPERRDLKDFPYMPQEQQPIGFHPGARFTDPITSHEASDSKDHGHSQAEILANVKHKGPGTEEMILTRMGVRQRSDASSEISALVKGGHLVNLIDPRTNKTIKLRNTSNKRALVRGLPAHQNDRALIEQLLVRMDSEDATERKRPASDRSAKPAKKERSGFLARS